MKHNLKLQEDKTVSYESAAMTMEKVMVYNKHYIVVDDRNQIVDGWSDGPCYNRDNPTKILLTDQGGYQFRLFPGGEENPSLFDWNGTIPLYKWEGGEVVRRTEEEIEADRAEIPIPESAPTTEERLSAVEETTAQQGEILNILLSGETGVGV